MIIIIIIDIFKQSPPVEDAWVQVADGRTPCLAWFQEPELTPTGARLIQRTTSPLVTNQHQERFKLKFTKSVWITGYYDAISFAFASAVLHVSVSSSHTAVRPSCPLANFTVNWKSKDGCSLWKFSKWINPIDCIYQAESILCNMGGEHSFTTLKDYVREVWLAQKWNNVILIYSKVLTRGQSPPPPTPSVRQSRQHRGPERATWGSRCLTPSGRCLLGCGSCVRQNSFLGPCSNIKPNYPTQHYLYFASRVRDNFLLFLFYSDNTQILSLKSDKKLTLIRIGAGNEMLYGWSSVMCANKLLSPHNVSCHRIARPIKERWAVIVS